MQKFWAGKKNQLLPHKKNVKKMFQGQKMTDWLIFWKLLEQIQLVYCEDLANLNHLYHSPGDFFDLLFPKENKIKSWIKNCTKFSKLKFIKLKKQNCPSIPVKI